MHIAGENMEELNGAFALLVDNAIEMVVIYDNHGKILYSNSICNEELGELKLSDVTKRLLSQID